MYGKTIIENSLPIAWQRAVEFVLKSPMEMEFGGGTERKKILDSKTTIILDRYAVEDALNWNVHPDDPFCSPARLQEYVKEYREGFDASKFDYTYRDRLENAYEPINQIDYLRSGLELQIEEKLSSNRNVGILYHPWIDNDSGLSRPCWNHVLIRWEKPGWASVHTLFRSHDLGQAWNSNIVAMTGMVYDEIIKPNNCKILYWEECNYSLHIYKYNIDELNNIRQISRHPQRPNNYENITMP